MASLIVNHGDCKGLLKDERTQDWILVKNPLFIDVLVALYFAVFIAWKIRNDTKGPIPVNRQVLELTIDLNNMILAPANWIIAVWMSYCMTKLGYNVFCTSATSKVCTEHDYRYMHLAYKGPIGEATDEIRMIRYYEAGITTSMWFFLILKILEMSDTLILAMEDRMTPNSWFSSLLLHHGGLVLLTWFGVVYYPAGTPALLATINSFAHAVSYTGLLYRNNFYLTREQRAEVKSISQSCTKIHFILIILICGSACLINCGLPPAMLIFVGGVSAMLLVFNLY